MRPFRPVTTGIVRSKSHGMRRASLLKRLCVALALLASTLTAADWREATTRLMPGNRLEVEHKGKIEQGIYALSNAREIVITTRRDGVLSIPQAEVDRIIRKGTDSPELSYFGSATDQLFPKPEVVYQRPGAVPLANAKRSRGQR